MTILIFSLFIFAVVVSVVTGTQLVHAMGLGCILFFILARKKGFAVREIGQMMFSGVRTSFPAFFIFLLVGILTAAWRASGTISYFVYWGVRLISPKLFLFCVYLILAAESMLIGTSFGSTGTLGVMLLVMAKSGGVPETLTAGAIIAGAMMGDRGSPMSGSANLVAAVTNTNVNDNVKRMIKSGILPFLLTAGLFLLLSFRFPLAAADTSLAGDIAANYRLSPLLLLPAAIVLILPLFRVNIKITMGVSLAAASVLALLLQGMPILAFFKCLIFGYKPAFTGLFSQRIAGGGLQSMFLGALVVLLASTFAGIFDKTGVLKNLEDRILQLAKRTNLFTATLITGLATAMVGCSQALAVILTGQMMKKTGDALEASSEERAMHMENTVVVLSSFVPWNICCSSQLAILGVSPACLLFAFYLYLVPLVNLAGAWIQKKKAKESSVAV